MNIKRNHPLAVTVALPNSSPQTVAARALKFVKVALTKDGFLTDVSVAMLIVEMERRGIRLTAHNAEER